MLKEILKWVVFMLLSIMIGCTIYPKDLTTHYYFNESNDPVSKEEHISISNERYAHYRIKSETETHHKVITRENSGYLDDETFGEIQSYLKMMTEGRISFNRPVVIYYYNLGEGLPHLVSKKFLKKWARVGDHIDVVKFCSFGIDNAEGELHDYKLYHDKDDVFKPIFFNNSNLVENIIIIRPDKQYYTRIGKVNFEKVVDLVNNGWERNTELK